MRLLIHGELHFSEFRIPPSPLPLSAIRIFEAMSTPFSRREFIALTTCDVTSLFRAS
jgi:hypothetical protein